MEKYCISRQKTGTRGFWRLISGLIWFILELIYIKKVPESMASSAVCFTTLYKQCVFCTTDK